MKKIKAPPPLTEHIHFRISRETRRRWENLGQNVRVKDCFMVGLKLLEKAKAEQNPALLLGGLEEL